MVISDKQQDVLIFVLFIVLIALMGIVLYQINYIVMPIFKPCADDFALIEKCKCLPQNYSHLFPNG